MDIKSIWTLTKPECKLHIQLYIPEVQITRNHFFVGCDTRIRLGRSFRYHDKVIGFSLLGFGIGFSWGTPVGLEKE